MAKENGDRVREIRIGGEGNRLGELLNQNSIAYNPLFLSGSDHPGMQLIATKFNGRNFSSWSRGIRMALGAKMKLGFITGACVKPSEVEDDYDRWLRADYMVMCWILNTMNTDIAENFMYVQSAKQHWDEIVERFSESNAPLIYQLHRELSNASQENMLVVAYFSKLKRIWDELMTFEGNINCECGALTQCRCAVVRRLLDREAKARLMHFLMGLADTFEHVRNSILSMEVIPSLNKAFHMVLQIERQKEVTGGATSSSADSRALAVGRNFQPKQSESSKGESSKSEAAKREMKKAKYDRKCFHCGEKGHMRESCFKLIGYPDWYTGPRDGGSSQGNQQGKNFVAQIQDVPSVADSPFDSGDVQRVDSGMVNAVYNEIMKRMKGKGKMDMMDRDNTHSMVNFAGPFN